MDFEILGENLKIRWCEGFVLGDEEYRQSSGYIFNDKNELLIVKVNGRWTVPGGHPEEGEAPLDTMKREVMEEACVNIKDAKYLGAVEVHDNGEIYYQMRYFAYADEVLEFNTAWESEERMFVPLDELDKYIKWSKGVTFLEQISSCKKNLK